VKWPIGAALFIAVGAVLISNFHWIIYVFGAFVVYTGYQMFKKSADEMHRENNPLVRWFVKKGRVTSAYQSAKFFVRLNGENLSK